MDARGDYVLNGNFVVSAFHKELHVSGTILEYSGSGTIVERINGTGMIYEDIHVQVCYQLLFMMSSVVNISACEATAIFSCSSAADVVPQLSFLIYFLSTALANGHIILYLIILIVLNFRTSLTRYLNYSLAY